VKSLPHVIMIIIMIIMMLFRSTVAFDSERSTPLTGMSSSTMVYYYRLFVFSNLVREFNIYNKSLDIIGRRYTLV